MLNYSDQRFGLMDHTYECSLCDRSLISSFYLCSNCHICCFRCYSTTRNTSCRICGLRQVYCCEFSKYTLERANGLLFRRSSGPIVVLPTSQENMKIRRMSDNCELGCEEAASKKLMKCLDCQKCVFSSRVLEHYVCEHKTTLVCPVPPGSMVTFRLHAADFETDKVKKLHVFQLMDISDESSYSDEDTQTYDGDEKLFFLMGTKKPFFGTGKEPNFIVRMWVLATFHACYANYSLEVTSCRDNNVSVLFTGVPIGGEFWDRSEGSGQVLHVRESLLEHLEHNGGCTVNFYIHNDTVG